MIEEINIENNEYTETYPTKIVIKSNLEPNKYILSVNERTEDISKAKNALKITLEINGQGFSKKDIAQKLNQAFAQLKEYFC